MEVTLAFRGEAVVTTIKVSCDRHGEQVMLPRGCHITIRVPGRTTVEFFTLCCKRYQVAEITNVQVEELRRLGVVTDILEVPAEALEPHKGPPIGLADLNVALAQLNSPDGLRVPNYKPLIRKR